MKTILLLTILSFANITVVAQNNYILLDVSKDTDLLRNLSSIIDSVNKVDLLNTLFKPVDGEFTTYRFVESYYGESPRYLPDSTVVVLLVDILILVVDKKDRIKNGFQFSLQYPEQPASCDLYCLVNKKRVKLNSSLNLSCLKFKLLADPEYCGKDPILYLSQSHLISD
jgi:hypothetical protein